MLPGEGMQRIAKNLAAKSRRRPLRIARQVFLAVLVEQHGEGSASQSPTLLRPWTGKRGVAERRVDGTSPFELAGNDNDFVNGQHAR